MPHPRPSAALLAELSKQLGSDHVLTDADVVAGYSIDWTGRFGAPAAAVLRPGTTEEVAAVVGRCAEAGVALVPQGGNSGLVGGGVPRGPQVVVSLTRLGRLDPVDHRAGQVTAGAGVTLAAIQAHAAAAGWRYPVDFGARAVATVGGMVATNAGGAHVVRHGPTRAQLAGVEVVWGDGTVSSRLGGLAKDNTGLDTAALVCGSEGTLGLVTAARLRLQPAPASTSVAWIRFSDLGLAMAGAAELVRSEARPSAVEFVAPECVTEGGGEAVLLVEVDGPTDPTPALAAVVGSLAGVVASEVATDPLRRSALWSRRDEVPELVRRHGIPLKLDVAVPLPALPGFLDELPALVGAADAGAHTWRFGHAGDGNVHVNVTGATDPRAVEVAVIERVLALGGTPAAEHGIGVAKVDWLERARGRHDVALMARIKAAVDPAGVMNPGVWGL